MSIIDQYAELERRAAPVLGEHDLTMIQYRRLRNTVDRGPITTGEWARANGVACPTTTTLLDNLEAVGWIKRIRSTTDRRTVIVSPQRLDEWATVDAEIRRMETEIASEYAANPAA